MKFAETNKLRQEIGDVGHPMLLGLDRVQVEVFLFHVNCEDSATWISAWGSCNLLTSPG
jgi:hypothetical protein